MSATVFYAAEEGNSLEKKMSATTILGLFGAALLAIALFRLLRQRGALQSLREQESRALYHAVAVKSSDIACSASQHLKNRVFLSAEAPRIPLTECSTSEICSCTYEHYDDRRHHDRRNRYATKQLASDRRDRRGRRSLDMLQPSMTH